jgi:DNA repair exonuclease SbcCD nuclease subunit
MTQLTQTIKMQIKNSEVGIFSDPHYGVHRNSETWHKIALDHAKWAAEQFKQRGIKDIIIPGDIFHDRNDIAVNTLHVVTDIFDVLRDFNIIITVGNHDAYYRDNSSVNSVSILRGWSNITVVDTLVVEKLQGKTIAFCPWGQDIDQVPKCDLIIGHFEINSFKMNTYKVCTNGLKASDLTERAPLTITGHFHHREERKYENGTILYVGSPYQEDWGDFGTTKGLYILDLNDLSYKFIENNISPRYMKLRYTELTTGVYTPDTLKAAIKGNIVKFYVDQVLEPSVLETIVRKLVAIKPVEFTIEHDVTEQSKVNIEEAANKEFNISVEKSIDEFIDLMDVKNKLSVKTYISDLYERACKL